ncbi:hypothetical protein [Stenotrophomonas sp.]|uniref:hypothetical protein n=1 Tax=Stenotrophomonas sp. TaxID=69392 RepID=UPI002FC8F483
MKIEPALAHPGMIPVSVRSMNADQLVDRCFSQKITFIRNQEIPPRRAPNDNAKRIEVSATLRSIMNTVDEVNGLTRKLFPLGAANQIGDVITCGGRSLMNYREGSSLLPCDYPPEKRFSLQYGTDRVNDIIRSGTGVCDDFAKVAARLLARRVASEPVSIAGASTPDGNAGHAFVVVGDHRETNDAVVCDPWVALPSAHPITHSTLIDHASIRIGHTYPPGSTIDGLDDLAFDPARTFADDVVPHFSTPLTLPDGVKVRVPDALDNIWNHTRSNDPALTFFSRDVDPVESAFTPDYHANVAAVQGLVNGAAFENGRFQLR